MNKYKPSWMKLQREILMGNLNAGPDNRDRAKHGQTWHQRTAWKRRTFHRVLHFQRPSHWRYFTVFPHKTTWTSPGDKPGNQIKHNTIGRKWGRSLQDVRVKRGTDAASDDHLVVAVLEIKMKAYNDWAGRPSHKLNLHSVKEKGKSEFKFELRNTLSELSQLPEDTIKELWYSMREIWTRTCQIVLVRKTRNTRSG